MVFAKVRPGEMRFMGYSQAESLLPKVQVYRDWQELLAQWKRDAEALGDLVRRRRRARRPEGRAQDLPPLRPADALPRVRKTLGPEK